MPDHIQQDHFEARLARTIGIARLSNQQRERHLKHLRDARKSSPFTGRRRELAEFGVVVTVLLIALTSIFAWQRISNDSDDVPVTIGVPVADVLAASGDLKPGQARHVSANISADYRLDQSSLFSWSVESWERKLDDKTMQMHIIARDPAGTIVAEVIQNGERWYWNQRGWIESGDTSLGVAPMAQELTQAMGIVDRPAGALRGDSEYELLERKESDSILTRRYGFGAASFQMYVKQQLGPQFNQVYYELQTDTDGEHVLQDGTYIVDESRQRYSLGTTTFNVVESLSADDVDNGLFDVPVVESPDALQYAPPPPGSLPLDLVVSSHTADFPAGTELATLEGSGITIDARISASRGGYDPRPFINTRSDRSLVHTHEFPFGTAAWLVSEDSDVPRSATWDDGRYRFELSIDTSVDPGAWNEDALIALIESLSGSHDQADAPEVSGWSGDVVVQADGRLIEIHSVPGDPMPGDAVAEFGEALGAANCTFLVESPDGNRIAVGDFVGEDHQIGIAVYARTNQTFALEQEIPVPNLVQSLGKCQGVAFSFDGATLYVPQYEIPPGGSGNDARYWLGTYDLERQTWGPEMEIPGCRIPSQMQTIAPNHMLVLCNLVYEIDTTNGQIVQQMGAGIQDVSFLLRGESVYISAATGTIVSQNLRGGEESRQTYRGASVNITEKRVPSMPLGLDPSGRYLYVPTASIDTVAGASEIAVIDLEQDRLAHTIEIPFTEIAFAPDGVTAFLATDAGGQDRLVRLDLSTGEMTELYRGAVLELELVESRAAETSEQSNIRYAIQERTSHSQPPP